MIVAANHISQIQGIVNGTTNFMLTKMKRENMGFDEALKIAQQLGYAETKDPGDDVDGRDACRKIAILASLACAKIAVDKRGQTVKLHKMQEKCRENAQKGLQVCVFRAIVSPVETQMYARRRHDA